MRFRVKCPRCGNVTDVTACAPGLVCPSCRSQFDPSPDGALMLYRMGNFFGAAAKLGVYINEQPYGYIGNAQSMVIPLPYGDYTVHFRIQGSWARSKDDLTIHLTPQYRVFAGKVQQHTGAFSSSYTLNPCSPSEIPDK